MNKIFGMPCVITSHKKRCKVSNYKLIDWLYKKIYGYKEYEETLTHNIAPSPKVLHDKVTSEMQKELMDVLDKWSKIEN